jgi:transcriptional regulator NrdR family protein
LEATVNTAKNEILSLLRKLPDECVLEDGQYHLYVTEKIRKGIERAESEGAVSQEEVERRLAKWTSREVRRPRNGEDIGGNLG